MKTILKWLFKEEWDELADKLDRDNFDHYMYHRGEKDIQYLGEKVYLNEKEQRLTLWIKKPVKRVEIFTEDDKYYEIEIN